MRVEDLELFVLVAEAGSFSAAANRLDLPRANVSRRIGELEKTLGSQLFYRTTRSLNLTPLGEGYYHDICVALEAVNRANENLKAQHSTPSGKLRLGSVPNSEYSLSPLIAKFQAEYPQIEIELFFTHNAYDDFFTQSLDLALHAGELRDSNFIARRVADFTKRIYASPAYLAKRGYPANLQDLAEHSCLCYRWPNGELERVWRTNLDEIELQPKISTNHIGLIKHEMIQGHGVGFMPSFLVSTEVKSGQLVPILEKHWSEQMPVWLIYPDRKGMTSAHRAAIDFMLKHIPEYVELSR